MLQNTEGEVVNITVLQGHLTRPPEVRSLPSGDVLVSYDVTVAATERRRAESVPVVWPDAPAGAADLEVGTDVVVVGRVRRRFFRTGGGTQSRTEVVASQLIPARRAKRVERTLLGAVQEIEDALR